MTPEQRRSLRAHLLASGIAGETATTRENTVANAEKLAEGDPDKHLGVGARGRDAPGVWLTWRKGPMGSLRPWPAVRLLGACAPA